MTFQQLLLILRARWKIIFITLAVVVGLTVLLSLLLPKQYTASTAVVVDFKGTDLISGMLIPGQLVPGYMATQGDIVQSHRVALEVVRQLKLASNPAAREEWLEKTNGLGTPEDWLADLLLKNLDVKPERDSSVIEISYQATDPQFAAVIANAFAQAYQKINLDLLVEPARQAAIWFDTRLDVLRDNLEAANANLSRYQREKGIVAADERLDVETARLSELSAQLSQAQSMVADSFSKQKQLSDFMAKGHNPESMPEVLANGLIQGLKSQLSQSESRLQQVSSQLGSNHPEVQRLKADIQGQKAKLKQEIAAVAEGMVQTYRIAQRRENELRAAVATQKSRLMGMNQGRDELSVLVKEVETAQRGYEAAAVRLTQTNLESQASQTNIAVLNEAVPPIEPSFPNLLLNIILAVVLGTVFGVFFALLAEMLDVRVRSAEDLLNNLDYPVLGVLGRAKVGRLGRKGRYAGVSGWLALTRRPSKPVHNN